jgi:hypothetical protein
MTASVSNEDLARFDPAGRFLCLAERARLRYQRSGFTGLNDAERTVLALFEFDNETCNGGFGQWLYQTPMELVAILPECLARVGEVTVLEHVRAIFDELGPAALRLGQRDWEEHLGQMPEAFWQQVGARDRAVGPLERGMIERIWAYAETVVSQLRAP